MNYRHSIKAALARKGWTQEDLARHVGVSPQAVCSALQGEPRQETLERIAKALGTEAILLTLEETFRGRGRRERLRLVAEVRTMLHEIEYGDPMPAGPRS